MAIINQIFEVGTEYIYSITSIPGMSTETATLNSLSTSTAGITLRKIDGSTFGLTCSNNTNTTGDIILNITIADNSNLYDSTINVTFSWVGTLMIEPVRIYNNDSAHSKDIQIYRYNAASPTLDIYYYVGLTKGDNFTHYINSSTYGNSNPVLTITIPPYQSVWIYSDTMTTWCNYANSSFNYIYIRTPEYTNANYNTLEISGNIMSLINGGSLVRFTFYSLFTNCYALKSVSSDFLPATTLAESCYQNMFKNCKSLTTTPTLPASTLADYCYSNMFYGCTSLTTAPTLNATTLTIGCYMSMFQSCTALTTAPALNATTLTINCYASMFQGCTSLTTAPTLNATSLQNSCYSAMFQGCTALTTAPALPATTLNFGCYNSMFIGCTSLTTAPDLSATTLTDYCYKSMFQNCTSLNYIKMLATNISASNCLTDWVKNVAASGTFVKNASMSSLISNSSSGIPSGWTVLNNS